MRSINKYGFLNALISIINSEEEDNSKVVIAKYLLQNFERIHRLNIYEAADECFVTRAVLAPSSGLTAVFGNKKRDT